jgi:hypothetical protein
MRAHAGRAGPVAGRRRTSRVDRHHHRLASFPVFLLSLKALIETRTGAPSPDDVPISDWH